jgi:hypothetical protein
MLSCDGSEIGGEFFGVPPCRCHDGPTWLFRRDACWLLPHLTPSLQSWHGDAGLIFRLLFALVCFEEHQWREILGEIPRADYSSYNYRLSGRNCRHNQLDCTRIDLRLTRIMTSHMFFLSTFVLCWCKLTTCFMGGRDYKRYVMPCILWYRRGNAKIGFY